MTTQLPNLLNVVLLRNEPPEAIERIRAIAPDRIRVHLANEQDQAQERRTEILQQGHVAFIGSNCPRDLHSRMPSLLWAHAGFAGVTDLSDRDLWGKDIILTSSRGYTGALPIAEMALIGGLMIGKDLHRAARTLLTRKDGRDVLHPWLVTQKTMGVVGLGGIGGEVARLAKGLGMRVIGTRRSAQHRTQNADGIDEVFPSSELVEMAKQSHFLAVCAASTPETYRIVNAAVMDALPDAAIIMNVARGEIIDEDAMIQRLESGKLGGAYLDVYTNERERDPDPRLANHPNVILTPHISDRSDIDHHFAVDLFCDNLQRFLDRQPLINEVDWSRGY